MNLGQMPSVSKATVGFGFSNKFGPQRIKLLSKLRQLRGGLRLREDVGSVAGRFEIVEWGHSLTSSGDVPNQASEKRTRGHDTIGKLLRQFWKQCYAGARSLQMLRGKGGHSQPHDGFHESEEKLHRLVMMSPLLLSIRA